MELTWDAQARSWVSDVSRAGPAGTAALTVGGVWVEFDRVDGGRIVSLVVPAESAYHVLLGDAELPRPPARGRTDDVAEFGIEPAPVQTAEVDLTESPLFLASREFALAAALMEDAVRLERTDVNAAAVAYLELVSVLADLGDLAPASPDVPRARLRALQPRLEKGRPNLYEEGEDRYSAIARRVLELAPDASELAELIQPGLVRREPSIPIPRRAPSDAENASHDADRGADEDLLTRVRRANELGRDALRLEQSDPGRAASAWRRCAHAWHGVGETGRAAIALDRAADTAREGESTLATADRYRAAQLGPNWTMPYLGGRTGAPHRPLWNLAYGIASLPGGRSVGGAGIAVTVPAGAQLRPAALLTKAVQVPITLPESYVFISYAREVDDGHYVRQLAEALTREGIPVWYDRRLDPARQSDREVEERIAGCAAFIVVMTPPAASSRRVRWELDQAFVAGQIIRPILRAGLGFASLANVRYETVPPGQILPSGAFLDQLRADLAAATRPGRRRFAPVVGRSFPPAAQYFVGRDDSLRRIAATLSAREVVAVRAARGAAGVGKSQLAAEYAHLHRAEYDLIAWIDAERPELIADQIAGIAPRLGVPAAETAFTTARHAVEALSSTDLRWLFVLDNAEQESLEWWLPGARRGHVIVTSRQTVWDAPTVEVDLIGRRDAVELLRRTSSTVDGKTADAIVGLLGGLPLALEQAAGHLTSTDDTADDYLGRLRDRYAALSGAVPGDLRPIATVWEVGQPRLQKVSRASEQLLELCAFLGPEPIPFDLYTQHPGALPNELATAADDPASFADTVRHLVRRGLARENGDGMTVHRLLARAVRRPLDLATQQARASTVRELLARHVPGDAEGRPNTLSMWRALMPHVLSATDPGPRPEDPDRMSWLLARAGDYLRREGEAAAGPLLERAVRIDEQQYGRRHPFVARRLSSLALTLKDVSGRTDEALSLLERALKIDEAALGRNHPHVAADLRNLAAVLKDLGQTAAAQPLLERALAIDETVHGPNHPCVADDLFDLAAVLNELGKSDAAERLSNRAMDIDKADSPDWREHDPPTAI